jgi:hypothetical protein
MDKLIDVIVAKTYNKYGKLTLFREYDFKSLTVDKLTAFYRVQSAINYPYIYEIQLQVFDKVLYKPRLNTFHHCIYCTKKGATYKFNCCDKYTHFGCGVKNNFACCHLDSYLYTSHQEDCSVCLEPTDSTTECRHTLCLSCLITMCQVADRSKTEILCPYCRCIVIAKNGSTDYHSIKVNNMEEVVCISYL